MKFCKVCGKEQNPLRRGMCSKHYQRFMKEYNGRKYGEGNEYIINGDVTEVILFDKSGNEKARVLIDTEDIDLVKTKKWSLSSGYAQNFKGYGDVVKMHRLIAGAKELEVVDHINRNKLDNRKSNLRITDNFGNMANKSTYKNSTSGVAGVNWNKNKNKWEAKIQRNGKRVQIGAFNTKEEAIKARLDYEKEL